MTTAWNPPNPWGAVAALGEPQRRRVYEAAVSGTEPVTRDQVADAVGISRSLAAFHLDKLVDAGLLEADARAPVGSRSRKIGRPVKRYRRSGAQIDLTLPARRYELAGRILTEALEAATRGEPAAEVGRRIAHEQGHLLGAGAAARGRGSERPIGTARQVLDALGYASVEQPGRVTLANCPFDALVQVAPQLTCGINLALVEGLLEGLGIGAEVRAAFEPQPGACCVTLAAEGGGGADDGPAPDVGEVR